MTLQIIGQAIGVLGAALNIISYQFKRQRTLILISLASQIIFCVSYIMLGAVTGGILNGIGVIRCIVYYNKDKFKSDKIWWLFGFIVLYVASYVLNFTVLGKTFDVKNAILEVLPVIGMIASNIGLMLKEAKDIRRFALISSPVWLIYNAINLAIAATVTEIIALVSVTIAIIRLDINRKGKKTTDEAVQAENEN